MERRVLEVLQRIILYLVDVVTDWINGVQLINRTDLNISEFAHQREATNSTLDLPECPSITKGHTLGIATISLTWLPAGILAVISKSPGVQPKQPIYMIAFRFIAWPVYVPLLM